MHIRALVLHENAFTTSVSCWMVGTDVRLLKRVIPLIFMVGFAVAHPLLNHFKGLAKGTLGLRIFFVKYYCSSTGTVCCCCQCYCIIAPLLVRMFFLVFSGMKGFLQYQT